MNFINRSYSISSLGKRPLCVCAYSSKREKKNSENKKEKVKDGCVI